MAALALLVGVLTTTAGPAANFQSVGLYQSFEELTDWAHDFATANADIVHLIEYGRSFQDRPLLALQMTLGPGTNDPAKPEFLFTAGIHAREVIASEAAYRLAETLAESYRGGDSDVHKILREREVWILPNLNPDGRIRFESGDSLHRKNMEMFPGQSDNYTRGVDVNRNFPHRWLDAPDDVLSDSYRGTSALSTLEAASLWSLLGDDDYFSDFRAAIDFHSGAETILSPWISPTEFAQNPPPPEDLAKLTFLAEAMGARSGLGAERLDYDAYGTLTDSLYETFGAYSFTEELYRGPFHDYFTYFNPLNQSGIDTSVGRAIHSAMFLLGDEAFPIVPEPPTALLVVLAVLTLRLRPRRAART